MRARRWPIAVVLLSAGCATGVDEPVTEQGGHFRDLWSIFLPIAIGVVLLIWGLVLFSVIRYRRRGDAVPDQRQYHVSLEVAYTVAPLLLVIGLFALSVRAERPITELSDDPDERVTVIGFQWGWEFEYPEHDITVAAAPGELPLLVLPAEQTTRLDLEANDVIHSFWVPRFLTKRDLVPGVENAIDVDPTEPGEWVGHCAEFCGLDHWKMSFQVQVVSPGAFDDWVAAAIESGDPNAIPPPKGSG